MNELERLDLAISERQTALRSIKEQIKDAEAALKRATVELGQTRSELRSSSSDLLERFQSETQIAGLTEQDICEDYALEYAREYCESKQDASYEDEPPCSGRGCP